MALVERCSTEQLPEEPFAAYEHAARPQHVGVLAIEVYIPATYVSTCSMCALSTMPSHTSEPCSEV